MNTESDLMAALAALRSRGEIKRFGVAVDRDNKLRALLERAAERRGLDSAAASKKLIRGLLDRASSAQIRTNPIHVDEPFSCIHCGHAVSAGGNPVRDHCSRCLRSLHVDNIPGDRAALCRGILDPVRLELDHGHVVIHYRCRRCQHEARTRAHPDDQIPPSLDPADLTD